MASENSVLILDFGCCFSGVLVRVVRDLGVACVLEPVERAVEALQRVKPLGVILCGGLDSAVQEDAILVPQGWWDACVSAGVKVLAISHAHFAQCRALGGSVVQRAKGSDYVAEAVRVQRPEGLLEGLTEFRAHLNPVDSVASLPAGFVSLAKTAGGEDAAVANVSRGFFGVAFHPEADATEDGVKILSNFCFKICKCPAVWNMENYLEAEVKRCVAQCGSDKIVVAGLSGGVDSTVCAAIVQRAIGNRFHGVMVDTGLMRLNEIALCAERLRREIPGIQLHIRQSADVFFAALKGVLDPEQKRKIIGKVYIDEFKAAITELGFPKDRCLLLQGTIYPDILESELNRRSNMPIKSHHNVGGLPEDLKLELIEPVRLLFKEEVRKLGRLLGLSEESFSRQPFPGPGLGVRVIGELNPVNLDIVRRADHYVNKVLDARGYRSTISQSGCILLANVRNTGIRNSARTFALPVVVRIIVSKDFVTAKWARHIDAECLAQISREITDNVPEVTRVCYDITDKPPACVEWE